MGDVCASSNDSVKAGDSQLHELTYTTYKDAVEECTEFMGKVFKKEEIKYKREKNLVNQAQKSWNDALEAVKAPYAQ